MNLYLLISLAVSSSVPQILPLYQPVVHQIATDAIKIEPAETTYYIYKDGQFEETVLTKKPELIGGAELMEVLLRLNIRYPELAKEKKIGGTVFVSVVIDADGHMEDAFIHEGIGGGCNDAALRAIRLLDQTGFEPAEIRGKTVTVKYDIPVTFLPK